MSERQRRATRPPRSGGEGPPSDNNSLDVVRQEAGSVLDAAQRMLNAASRNVAQAQAKDQVPPGTFHSALVRPR